ncbi:Metallo-dependent phosphatase-like protein [Syncephalis fuscata]|nr:Metallo-dependent phosphatase-like protein [Syncephalis fuscata]
MSITKSEKHLLGQSLAASEVKQHTNARKLWLFPTLATSLTLAAVLTYTVVEDQAAFNSPRHLKALNYGYDEPPTPLYGRFLHLTDMHPDHHYKEGNKVKYQCHRSQKESPPTITSEEERVERRDSCHAIIYRHAALTVSAHEASPQDEEDTTMPKSFPRPPRYKMGDAKPLGMPLTKCDSPWSLINGTVDWLLKHVVGHRKGHEDHGKEHLGVDFIICTGDNARHDSDTKIPRSLDHIMTANSKVATMLDERLSHVPIVFTIGNNDVYPHNVMERGPNYILRGLLNIWKAFIPENQVHVFLEGGYFIKEVVPDQMTVISLNTIYFFRSNPVVDGCMSDEDPGSMQLLWLEQRLEELADRKMTTYIIGHVSPSPLLYHPQCLRRYSQIVRRWGGFANQDTSLNKTRHHRLRDQDKPVVVIGQFFGHSNVDHFYFLEEEPDFGRKDSKMDKNWSSKDSLMITGADSDDYLSRLFSQYKRAGKKGALGPVVQVAPSIIPTYNPSLRVMTYAMPKNENEYADYSFGQPIDYTQYYFDLLNINGHPTPDRKMKSRIRNNDDGVPVTYAIEYEARQTYNLSSLVPSELAHLAGRIYANDTLRHEYMRRYFVSTIE